jgi:CheY-like chemotaxis protein
VGKGSTFRCTFRARSVPLSAPLPQLPPSIFDATFASRFPHRILVAEDDAISRDVVELMLEHLGYTADFATNGREALEALERESYDFVLMDVQMPELDGLDATRRLRQRNIKHLWIVGLSAHAFQSSRDEAMAAGMNDYLTKPVSVASLAEAFNRAPPRPA